MSFYEAHDHEIPASDVDKARKCAEACGLKCAMYTPSFFADPVFKDGVEQAAGFRGSARGTNLATIVTEMCHTPE